MFQVTTTPASTDTDLILRCPAKQATGSAKARHVWSTVADALDEIGEYDQARLARHFAEHPETFAPQMQTDSE